MPPKQSGDSAAYKQLKQDIAAGTIGRLYVFHGRRPTSGTIIWAR